MIKKIPIQFQDYVELEQTIQSQHSQAASTLGLKWGGPLHSDLRIFLVQIVTVFSNIQYGFLPWSYDTSMEYIVILTSMETELVKDKLTLQRYILEESTLH